MAMMRRARTGIAKRMELLPRSVGRLPVSIHLKLLAAFLVIVVMLIVLGVAGLNVLGAANDRAEGLGRIEQKVAAYRGLQTAIAHSLYDGASAFSAKDEAALDTTVRQIRQSAYDFDRLEFVAKDEGAILDQIQRDHRLFLQQMVTIVEMVRDGRRAEALELQQKTARPLADSLERLTNELVDRAESEMVTTLDQNHNEYLGSRWLVVGLSLGSISLALVLGYAIALSISDPLKRIGLQVEQVASGDFSGHVAISNRDELGALAINVNRTNRELGRMYTELEAASRHKSEFLANMSHELRTPLNAVIGFSEVLAEHMFGELNEKQDEYVRDILTSGQHLLSLINDILDLSKIEAGRMELDLGPFALEEALENGMSMLRERALRGRLTLNTEIGADLGGLEADERKIKQVIYNLLSNAVKFTPAGGRVDVTARVVGEEAWVSVKDTGIGIAPEDQSRVFEEFMQASGRARQQEGTGLGLALAKRLVELHGGRIWLESEPGVGSTFTFSLPLDRTSLAPMGDGLIASHLTTRISELATRNSPSGQAVRT